MRPHGATGSSDQEPVSTALLAVGIARPDNWPPLDGLAEDVEGLRCLLTRHRDVIRGAIEQSAEQGGEGQEMQRWLEDWGLQPAARYALLLWFAHAPRSAHAFLLTTAPPFPT